MGGGDKKKGKEIACPYIKDYTNRKITDFFLILPTPWNKLSRYKTILQPSGAAML
jgi:hypothetical protein